MALLTKVKPKGAGSDTIKALLILFMRSRSPFSSIPRIS